MLREQLEELQRARRTLFHAKSSAMWFVEDDLDTAVLLGLLPFETPFTRPRSLSFDRHRLSEREEGRFNRRFAPFLRQLLPRMQDKGIDFLLEYLLRVYSVDTFNPSELLFLLLPFKRYARQLLALSRSAGNQFSSMEAYSVQAIGRILAKDRYLFAMYAEYFKSYRLLREFLDKTLQPVIDAVKDSDLDYLREFHQMMTSLISQGEHVKALEIYHRMESYLESDAFLDLLRPFCKENALASNSGPSHPLETVYRNSSGRALLKEPVQMAKYIKYLDLAGAVPREFNANEYRMLQILFLGRTHEITDYSDLAELYKEIEPRTELTKYLVENRVESFYRDLDDEGKILVVQKTACACIDLLTPSNHVSLVRNMRRDQFETHYDEILERCLGYKTFEPSLFCKPVRWRIGSDVVRTNVIRLAQHHGHDLTEELMGEMDDRIALGYLLRSPYPYDPEYSQLLVTAAKASRDPVLVSDLASFLNRRMLGLGDFCAWACTNGFVQCIGEIMDAHGRLIDSSTHYIFFTKTGSVSSLRVLLDRNYSLAKQLYDSRMFDCILQMSEVCGTREVLIDHPAVLDFIAGFADRVPDKNAVVGYLLDIGSGESLEHLARFLDQLICFREHRSWHVARAILLESLLERHQLQSILDYIVAHFGKFSCEDAALFDKVLESDAELDCSSLARVALHQESASFFVDSYIRHRGDNVLPVIPIVAPILIKFKKRSIVTLFERYTNIMGAYSGSILREYPEACSALLHVDPRYSLREICALLDDTHTPILLRILGDKKTNSLAIVERVARTLLDGLGAFTQHMHIAALLKFHTRSFGKPCDAITSLMRAVHAFDKAMFCGLVRDAIEHTFLFAGVVPDMVSDILSRPVCDDMLLLLSMLLDRHEHLELDALGLYMRVFDLRSTSSPTLIRSLCQSFGIGRDVLHHISAMLQSHSDVLYCLDILLAVFRHEETRNLGQEIIESIVVYTEDRDESVLSKSNELLEILAST